MNRTAVHNYIIHAIISLLPQVVFPGIAGEMFPPALQRGGIFGAGTFRERWA
ncbi:MAG: hypothetical protein ACP5DX_00010 [Paracoccaceae bacterium]